MDNSESENEFDIGDRKIIGMFEEHSASNGVQAAASSATDLSFRFCFSFIK